VKADAVQVEETKAEEKVEQKATPTIEPLGPGQQYFEAPTGEILIGSSDATRLFFRAGNNGEGMWINPKR
jgi:hypothetical protein